MKKLTKSEWCTLRPGDLLLYNNRNLLLFEKWWWPTAPGDAIGAPDWRAKLQLVATVYGTTNGISPDQEWYWDRDWKIAR
jgi:hypothetical protein